MKFYTLDFDCNTPTVQQVNVPTNTDYKVGIKVKRNGEYQALSPESVKLYTGETITVEPADFNADKELATSITGLIVALMPASISADLGGKTINTVVPEVSYDNGTTWGEVHTTVENDQYFLVMDKSQGNYYYARLNLKNPNSKWELLDGTPTGVVSTSDTITMPTNPQAFLNSNSSMWSITQFPCVFRLVIKYGGYSYQVYIDPDADKTNGYVTFTLSAGDEANYTSEKIDIEKGYDAEFYKPAFVEHNTTGAAEVVTIISADLSDFVGYTLKPEDIYYSALYRRSELSVAEIEEGFGPYWRFNDLAASAVEFKPFIEDKDGNTKMYLVVSQAWYNEYCNALGWPIDKPGFFVPNPDNPANMMIVDSYTVQEGDKLVMGKNLSVSKDRWFGGKISITAGTPFSAQFKLNTNIFKSQQGDIADGIESASTAKLTGVYADGTEFDYNIVIA